MAHWSMRPSGSNPTVPSQVLPARGPQLPKGGEAASESREASAKSRGEGDPKAAENGEAGHTVELLPQRRELLPCPSAASSHPAQQP